MSDTISSPGNSRSGVILSLVSIASALLSWFYLWAHGEYHARGGMSAGLSFLYLSREAREYQGVYGLVKTSLWNRCLGLAAAAMVLSLVAIILCRKSNLAIRALSVLGLAMIVLPISYFFIRLIS